MTSVTVTSMTRAIVVKNNLIISGPRVADFAIIASKDQKGSDARACQAYFTLRDLGHH